MKTNRFGILVDQSVGGNPRWKLIPWHSVESITAFDDKICIDLKNDGVWVESLAPAKLLESIFEDRGEDLDPQPHGR